MRKNFKIIEQKQVDPLRFNKEKGVWEVAYFMVFSYEEEGLERDDDGWIIISFDEKGEILEMDQDTNDDYYYRPELFIQCAKENPIMRERIFSCQYIIKSLYQINHSKGLEEINFCRNYHPNAEDMCTFNVKWTHTNAKFLFYYNIENEKISSVYVQKTPSRNAYNNGCHEVYDMSEVFTKEKVNQLHDYFKKRISFR